MTTALAPRPTVSHPTVSWAPLTIPVATPLTIPTGPGTAVPSPALMPRRSAVPRRQAAGARGSVLPVAVTVVQRTDILRHNDAVYLGCAAVHDVYSPVVAGPQAAVLRALAGWVSRRPGASDAHRAVQVTVLPGRPGAGCRVQRGSHPGHHRADERGSGHTPCSPEHLD